MFSTPRANTQAFPCIPAATPSARKTARRRWRPRRCWRNLRAHGRANPVQWRGRISLVLLRSDSSLVHHHLEYARGFTPDARRTRRWMMLVAVSLGLAYLVFLMVVAVTDPRPAHAARNLAQENAYGAMITG